MYFIRIYIVEQKSTLLTFNCRYTRDYNNVVKYTLTFLFLMNDGFFSTTFYFCSMTNSIVQYTCLKYSMPMIHISSCVLLAASHRNTIPLWQRALLWTSEEIYFFPNIYLDYEFLKQRETIKKSAQVLSDVFIANETGHTNRDKELTTGPYLTKNEFKYKNRGKWIYTRLIGKIAALMILITLERCCKSCGPHQVGGWVEVRLCFPFCIQLVEASGLGW